VQTYEKADGSWYDDPAKCPVAPIFRLGIYAINDLVALFGEAERVQVLSSRLFTGRPTPDHAQLGIRFKSGALANIFASFCVGDGDYYRNSLVLNFEHGTVYRNAGPVRTEPLTEQSELSLLIRKDGRRHLAAQAAVPASGEYRWDLFHRAIRGESIPDLLPVKSVVAGLKIIRAMSDAERHDGWAPVL
jgi:predicted dehydrogenase